MNIEGNLLVCSAYCCTELATPFSVVFPLQCEIDAAPLVFEQLRDYLSYHIGFVVINQLLVFVLCFSQEIHYI